MSSTANININLDSKSAEKNLRDLNKEGQKTNKTFQAVDKTFEEVYGDLKPLTNRLGETEDRLYELSLAGKRGTAEFKALLNEAARLRSQMIETDMVVDAMASTLTTKLLAGAGGVTATFGLAQGALVAFGSESEELNEALTRLAGIMTVLQSVNELRQSLPVLQGLLSGAGAQFNSLTDATKAATSANTSYIETGAEVVSSISDVTTATRVSSLAQEQSAEAIIKTTDALSKNGEQLGVVTDAITASKNAQKEWLKSGSEFETAFNLPAGSATADQKYYSNQQLKESSEYILKNKDLLGESAEATDLLASSQKSLNVLKEESNKINELELKLQQASADLFKAYNENNEKKAEVAAKNVTGLEEEIRLSKENIANEKALISERSIAERSYTSPSNVTSGASLASIDACVTSSSFSLL
jgi:hypothetical protein